MTDLLFPDEWHRIKVSEYVNAHRTEFDKIDLTQIPQYMLVQKISLGGTTCAILENDPKINEPKREALNRAMLKEVRWQVSQLVFEYIQRVTAGTVLVDDKVKNALSKHVVYEGKPPPVTVGLKSVELHAERG